MDSQLTLKSLFTSAMRRHGERTAVVFEGRELSYAELFRQSCRVAHAMIAAGVVPNTRVALMMSNCTEFAVADQAIVQSGAAKVPLNDMLGEDEIRYIVADSGARLAVVGPSFFDLVQRNRGHWPELTTIVGLADADACPEGVIPWQAFLATGQDGVPQVDVSPDDLARVTYTGGTTGMPKGVMHSQRSATLNMYAHVMEIGLQDDERLLLSSPLPHSAGALMMAGLIKGATHFIERRFDPETVVRRIEEDGVTFTFLVPTMIYRVLDWIGDSSRNLSSLRTIMYGAAPITVERLTQGLSVFGPVFMQLYGQSEVPNFITRLRREDHRLDEHLVHRLKSCGQPAIMAEVRIVDDNGRPVPTGESGEIAVRAPYTMLGYHGLPEKTAETLVGGWLHTGDIGKQDADGYVYLLDRKKDMIISGGMNVYSVEVESVVQSLPGVSQAAVVGLPDADWGEAVTACVVPEAGAELTARGVMEACRDRLSAYKRPKNVFFLDAMPLTTYGKLDKKTLRRWAAEGRIRGD
ncbi:MAG: long-chain-fatty-acid--CoA ligase [Ectothiorhodospiraceae bacterium]|nr:long-chain-fatty-acid--CoA ligase [Ectothiorhodospiraceae bacterium]